jgi:hypothetical protein
MKFYILVEFSFKLGYRIYLFLFILELYRFYFLVYTLYF